MKVTKTKTETTLYDTNGRKISLVKKEVVEVNTDYHYLGREDSKQTKIQGERIRQRIQENLSTRDLLIKSRGTKEGGKIFCGMAEQVMVVEMPNKTIITIPKESLPSAAHVIWEAANRVNKEFQSSPNKRNHKRSNRNKY